MNTYEFLTFLIGIILRLAIPVSATVMGVYLLRRLDARWLSEALKQATHVSGVIIPLQNLNCWDLHDCSPERRANCPASLNSNVPCWEVHSVNGHLQEACQHCAFHKGKTAAAQTAS